MIATTKPMTAEDRVKVVEADGGFELLVNGRAVDGFCVREAADTARGEWVRELESMREDAVREYTELLRKNCPHGCTNCEQAARKASYIRTEMGVTI